MRAQSIKFNDFMSGEYKKSRVNKKTLQPKLKAIAKGSVTIPIISLLSGNYAFAATTQSVPVVAEATKQSIIHAFDPLIELMTDLALPISAIMITGGALLILIGMKEKGFTLIMNSSLGYCLVQLSPLFISLLEQVGKAI